MAHRYTKRRHHGSAGSGARPQQPIGGNDLQKAAAYAEYLFNKAQEMGIKGFQKFHAAGILGHASAESGVNPAEGPDGTPGAGYGLVQWLGTRFGELQKFARDEGKKWSDAPAQLDFMLHEMFDKDGKEKKAGQALLATKNARDANRATSDYYVRHSKLPQYAKYDKRQGDAALIDAKLEAGEVPNTQIAKGAEPTVTPPQRAARAEADPAQRAAASGNALASQGSLASLVAMDAGKIGMLEKMHGHEFLNDLMKNGQLSKYVRKAMGEHGADLPNAEKFKKFQVALNEAGIEDPFKRGRSPDTGRVIEDGKDGPQMAGIAKRLATETKLVQQKLGAEDDGLWGSGTAGRFSKLETDQKNAGQPGPIQKTSQNFGARARQLHADIQSAPGGMSA